MSWRIGAGSALLGLWVIGASADDPRPADAPAQAVAEVARARASPNPCEFGYESPAVVERSFDRSAQTRRGQLTVPPPVEVADESETARSFGPVDVRLEYLAWRVRERELPPLVTTGPTTLIPPGVLGQPGTMVLFGGEVDDVNRHGAQLTLSGWLDEERHIGAEARAFFLGERTFRFALSSSGKPALARPFFDVLLNQSDVVLIAFPDLASGQIEASLRQEVWGFDVSRRSTLCADECYHLGLVVGFRYLGVEEDLLVASASQELPAGRTFVGFDAFRTRNRFLGGHFGAVVNYHHGPWVAELRTLLALGGMDEKVEIAGRTQITEEGSTTILPFNLLTQSTNIGRYRRNEFAAVPELNLRLGYQLTEWGKVYVGYALVYVTDLLRPANAIDLNINTSQFTGPPIGLPVPRFEFRDADLWMQGLTLGIEVTF